MIIIMAPLLDSGLSVGTGFWDVALPIIISAITGVLVAVISKLFDRKKAGAETNKISAETEKVKAETDKVSGETRAAESAEWQKLYDEEKNQRGELKKELDTIKTQVSILTDFLEIQKEEQDELEKKLEIEVTARKKLESVIKKFQLWAIRNREKLESAKIEPVPVLDNY